MFSYYLFYCWIVWWIILLEHLRLMGSGICPGHEILNGVVSNESKYDVSYVILSEKMKLKKKRIETNS